MSSRTRKAESAAPAKSAGKGHASAALAEAQLRASTVRVTGARLRVLSALLDAGRACSHQDMQDALADMDRVTLYRALDCLIDAGLAHKIAGDDRVFRYSAGAEHGATHHQHGHFKCTLCKRMFCLDSIADAALLEQTLQASLGKGFRSHDIEFTVKGWCAACTADQ